MGSPTARLDLASTYPAVMPKSKVRKRSRRPVEPGRSTARPAPFWLSERNLPPLSFPADLLGVDAPEHTRVELDLVVADPTGRELHRLEIRLTRRIRGQGQVELWGADRDDVLAIHVAGNRDGTWSIRMRVDAPEVTGQQCLRVLDFTEALRPPNAIALAQRGGAAYTLNPLLEPAADRLPPPQLRELVHAQVQIERALGFSLIVPMSYAAEEAKDLLASAALLRGETVSDTWDSLSWAVPVSEARDLLAGMFRDSGQVQIDLEREWVLQLGGRTLDVGVVLARHHTARLDPVDLGGLDDDSRITLHLRAGDDATVDVRLVEAHRPGIAGGAVPGGDEADVDQRWFWAPQWQQREREVDEHVEHGHVVVHDDADTFLSHVDGLARGQE